MITSKDNDMIKHISKLLSSAKYRSETGSFVAEGARLCCDGALSGAAIEMFLYTSSAKDKYVHEFEQISACSDKSFEIGDKLFAKISDTKTPQGFLCVFKTLDKRDGTFKILNQGHYAALENIQDPSNMGTILRTAEALGVDGVILSVDCCDIYSPKVVRGSMGAIFRVPVMIAGDFTGYISQLTQQGVNTYASTPKNAVSIDETDFSGGGVMLIGNEGNGLRPETIAACKKSVMIEMRGRAESLNAAAAAAILMYKLLG